MSEAAIALNRFGLGARPGDPMPDDPRGWLHEQLRAFDPQPAEFEGLLSQGEIVTSLAEYRRDLRTTGRRQSDQPAPDQPAPELDRRQALRREARQDARGAYLSQVGARTCAALDSETPFVERLVHFWANHFAVSIDKLAVTGLAGTLELDAIRPHVLGSFADMLIAVEQHPAMLLYLDQAQSVGPGSVLGTRAAARGARRAGLNENLAREIMELHTLGVRSGYSQADVTEFARALTGWTVSGLGRGAGGRLAPGAFLFAERLHEPGTRTIMGQVYAQRGEAQARSVLGDLARHPSTARHVATKLARHFAADDPPPALVDRLAQAFTAGQGDLPTLYAALIDAPESWAAAQAKFKTPWDWYISAQRGLDVRAIGDQPVANLMVQLGQPVWRPGSPAGYDDIAASWAGSEALIKRVEVAERIAQRQGTDIDARTLAEHLLPGTLSPATAQAIARADSPGQGLALLLVSPEFLRR